MVQASVDIGAIARFIDWINKRDPADALNEFSGLVQQRLGSGGQPANPLAGLAGPGDTSRPLGPTQEAAAISQAAQQEAASAPTALSRQRALLETIMSNPALVADLPAEALNQMVNAGKGLVDLEVGDENVSPELRRLNEAKSLGLDVSPETAARVLGLTPEMTSDLQELAAINAERTGKGLPAYGTEEGLRLLANLKAASGTSINVSPVIQIPDMLSGANKLVAQFTGQQEGINRREKISQLEPAIEQLKRAKALLETPGVGRWLIANPLGRGVAGVASVIEGLSGIPALSKTTGGVTPEQLGQNIATLQSGIGSAAATIARTFENDISEPTMKRLQQLAQTGDMTSNPDQALGALNELLAIIEGLQSQTSEELKQGGVQLEPGPSAPTPVTREQFNAKVNAAATRLLQQNPSRYPQGVRDPQLHLDAVQSVVKSQPDVLDQLQQLERPTAPAGAPSGR